MKRFLIFVLITLLIPINANAKRYKVNDTVENNFFINKKTKFELPEGKWIIAERINKSIAGIKVKKFTLLRIKNNELLEGISIFEWNTSSLIDIRYKNLVDEVISKALFKDRANSCNERQEYSILKFYSKGSTHNCLWVGHYDLFEHIYKTEVFYIYPSVSDIRTERHKLKVWLKKNKISIPKVGLYSEHSYFSRLKLGKWYGLTHIVNPKILNAPVNKFISVDSSEYHRNNIDMHPKHREIMNKWISISLQRHKNFENSIKTLEAHKLDLSF